MWPTRVGAADADDSVVGIGKISSDGRGVGWSGVETDLWGGDNRTVDADHADEAYDDTPTAFTKKIRQRAIMTLLKLVVSFWLPMLIGDDDGDAGWVHIRGGGGVGLDDDGCYGMLEALVRLEMRCHSGVQL